MTEPRVIRGVANSFSWKAGEFELTAGMLLDGALPDRRPLESLRYPEYLELRATRGYTLDNLSERGLREGAEQWAGVSKISTSDEQSRATWERKIHDHFESLAALDRARGEDGQVKISNEYWRAVNTARTEGRLSPEVQESIEGIAVIEAHQLSLGEVVQIERYGRVLEQISDKDLGERALSIADKVMADADLATKVGSAGTRLKSIPHLRSGYEAVLWAFEIGPAMENHQAVAAHRQVVQEALANKEKVPYKAVEAYMDLLASAQKSDLLYGEPLNERAALAQHRKMYLERFEENPREALRRVYEFQGALAFNRDTQDPLVIRKHIGDTYFVVNKRMTSEGRLNAIERLPEDMVTGISDGPRFPCLVGNGFEALGDLNKLFGPKTVQHKLSGEMIAQLVDVRPLNAEQVERLVNGARRLLATGAISRGVSESDLSFADKYNEEEFQTAVNKAVGVFGLTRLPTSQLEEKARSAQSQIGD